MYPKLFLFHICLLVLSTLHGQPDSLYEKRWLIRSGDTLPYRILLPKDFDASRTYPLIVFLHGSGERGRDNEKQLVHGARFFARDDIRSQYPAIVVFPQCNASSSWANYKIGRDSSGRRTFELQPDQPATRPLQLVEELITLLKKEFRLDKKKLYVGGLSMGGMGTFELTRRNPKLFAAAFPICGATDPSIAKKLRKMSWWIFHGAKDDVVPPHSSTMMAAALKKNRADVRFTLFPEANHNSWDPAFAEKDLMSWLFSRKK